MPSKLTGILLQKSKRTEFTIAAVIIILVSAGHFLGIFRPIDMFFYDAGMRLRGERRPPPQIAVIGIDEPSLDHPKTGPWPWSRTLHAQLLYQLAREDSRPRALGYDISFEMENPKDEPGDMALVYSAAEFPAELIIGYFFDKGFHSRYDKSAQKESLIRNYSLKVSGSAPPRLETFDKISAPFPSLAEKAALGFANIHREGRTRKIRLLASYRGKVYPSLDLLTLLKYAGAGPADVTVKEDRIEIRKEGFYRDIPVTEEGDMWINFYGDFRSVGRYYPFIHALLGDSILSPAQANAMKKSLKGSLVFAGRTALSLKDGYSTPFDSNMAAVFLRAQAAGNILEDRFIKRAPLLAVPFLVVLFAAATVVITSAVSIPIAVLCVFGLSLLHLILCIAAFRFDFWIEPAAGQLAIYLSFGSILLFRYIYAVEELRRTQNELLHSTKMAMVGHISSGMAHEFRNILHAVKLHVEGCSRPGMSPERIQKYMGVIFKILTNAEQILNGILTFSRKNESNRKLGNLKKTVEDTLLLIKKEMEYQNIKIVKHLGETADIAYDHGQMAQVIMNLINNARDALKNSKEKVVIVSLKEDPANIYLDIADNGPGIPPHVLKNLFQPFVTTKKEGKGTGLGLSICKGIVENHKGEIKVTSVEGRGTAWHIILPKE